MPIVTIRHVGRKGSSQPGIASTSGAVPPGRRVGLARASDMPPAMASVHGLLFWAPSRNPCSEPSMTSRTSALLAATLLTWPGLCEAQPGPGADWSSPPEEERVYRDATVS